MLGEHSSTPHERYKRFHRRPSDPALALRALLGRGAATEIAISSLSALAQEFADTVAGALDET
ncbi:MAG: hypothetical protein JOZ86_16635 [Candidatus Eremiobacteraeota bacterium]|nr:hypothetical protein [Candidatus Eremiobacteraeota bacterium]